MKTKKYVQGIYVMLVTYWPLENSHNYTYGVMMCNPDDMQDAHLIGTGSGSSNYEAEPDDDSMRRKMGEAIEAHGSRMRIFNEK